MTGERSDPGALLVAGIDPGTAVTGYGIVAREPGGAVSLVECGVIRTRSSDSLASRIRDIHDGISEVLARHAPDVVVVENVFTGRNPRSALTLGHTRGVILLAASLQERTVVEYTPREIKSTVVGHGDATKDQVSFMVRRHLKLKTAPKPDDAADGVAAALCYLMVAELEDRLAETGRSVGNR